MIHILSGVSGSGKSTLARSLGDAIVSADDYFTDLDGVYRFDPSQLSVAHAWCFREYLALLEYNVETIIVDNTNTTAVEIAPYVLAAGAYGREYVIRTIVPTATAYVLAARNSHGVSVDTILMQMKRIAERELPPWWVT